MLSLCQPIVCAGLKELRLTDVRLGISSSSPLRSSDHQVNHVMEELTLTRCTFFGRNAVSTLWRLVGIRILKIHGIFYEHYPDEDEYRGNDEGLSSVWQELIERTKMMESITLKGVDISCFDGVLQVAICHEKLESLHYISGPDIKANTLLRQVLQSSKTRLKVLSLTRCTVRLSGVEQIVQGICGSKSLVSVDLEDAKMSPVSATTIIGSILVNKTLEALRFDTSTIEIPYNGPFGSTLLSAVRVNTSLTHLCLPCVDLRGSMTEFLGGIGEKSRLRRLNLINCTMDTDDLVALGRALECQAITLDWVELP
jgi:hypothetical protein